MLFKQKSSPQQKEQDLAKKSIQDLIPIKDLEQGLFITPDLKMIQVLKVSAINLELTSIAEANELFELLEGFFATLDYHLQATNVSMPVDLSSYIIEQQKILNETKNQYKRMLQKSYIEYSQKIEMDQDIMQRQRFLVFSEQMKEDTDQVRYETTLDIIEKRDEIISAFSEMDLKVEPVTDIEIVRYFHTLFDYSGAQNRPIENLNVVQVIEGGKKNV